MTEQENIFDGCEDSLFAQAEADYERERKNELDKAACRVERKKLMVSSDRYLDTLELMRKEAESTETQIAQLFDSVSEKLGGNVTEIQAHADRAVRCIRKQAARTEKILRLTSRQQRLRFASLLAAAFLGGIVMTVFVYHAFIIGIMNKYLHHTIEIMAQQEIDQARKEADQILRSANIKADGILKSANSFIDSENDSHTNKKGATK